MTPRDLRALRIGRLALRLIADEAAEPGVKRLVRQSDARLVRSLLRATKDEPKPVPDCDDINLDGDVCALPAGHPGDHASEDAEWSYRDGPEKSDAAEEPFEGQCASRFEGFRCGLLKGHWGSHRSTVPMSEGGTDWETKEAAS